MTTYFEMLGDHIAAEWSRVNFDDVALPQIAAGALTKMSPADNVSPVDILSSVMAGSRFCLQPNIDVSFGQPPITMYSHPQFYIEALFWVTGTTSVHQHSFSGAFAVLEGSSLQSRYRFTLAQRVNAHMLVGDLELHSVSLLTTGAVEPIVGGSELIHSVFHLPSPSVTIVVRTFHDVEHLPQYDYFHPHIAVSSEYRDARLRRRRQVLQLCADVYPTRYEELAVAAIRHGDLLTAYMVLLDAVAPMRLSNSYGRLADAARDRHGEVVDKLIAAAEEHDRREVIAKCRRDVVDSDLRFFLALLLNVPSREWILRLLQERYPGTNIRNKVVDLASNLAPAIFGVEFEDLDRLLFRHLLDRASADDVLTLLESDYSVDEVASQREFLLEHCANLRRTAFKPLLTEAAG